MFKEGVLTTKPMSQIAFKDTNNFYRQFTVNFTVNYLLNPGTWTRPKVNTERSQMNNSHSNSDGSVLKTEP